MTNSQELALFSDFEVGAGQISTSLRLRKNLFVVLGIILLSLLSSVLLPHKGTADYTGSVENLLQILNQDRIKYGLKPLAPNPKLEAAAEAKAKDILKNNYFAHVSPTGREPWDFIKGQGFKYAFAGENLAINYTNPYELENDFMASPGHRENLLSPLFTEVGIAVLSGTYHGKPAVITVQMFASPSQTVAIQN